MSIIIPTSAFRSNGHRYLKHRAASHFISPIPSSRYRIIRPPLSPLLSSLCALLPSALSPPSASTSRPTPPFYYYTNGLLSFRLFVIFPSFVPLSRVSLFACAFPSPTCFSTIPPGATMTERPIYIYISWTRNFQQLDSRRLVGGIYGGIRGGET